MAQRKTLRNLDISILLSAITSVVVLMAMGVLVHGLMWAHIGADEAAATTAKPAPAPRVRISSKTLAA